MGQTKERLPFSICNAVNDTIKRSELNKCYELISLDKNLKIKSFEITFNTGPKYDKANWVVVVYKSEGDKFSNVARTQLKKSSTDRFYIENIIVSDGKEEKKYSDGLTIFIK